MSRRRNSRKRPFARKSAADKPPASTPEAGPELPIENLIADVGVVLIHGIGNQKSGSLLRQMGQPCIEALSLGAQSLGYDIMETKRLGTALGKAESSPRSTLITLQRGLEQYRIRFSEAIWSDGFTRPSGERVAAWALRSLPALMLLLSPDQRDSAVLQANSTGAATPPQKLQKLLLLFLPDREALRTVMPLARLVARILIGTLLITALVTSLNRWLFLPVMASLASWIYLRSPRSVAGHVMIAASQPNNLNEMIERVSKSVSWADTHSRRLILVAHS